MYFKPTCNQLYILPLNLDPGNLKFCQVPELLQRQDGIDNRDHGLAGIFNGILGVALGGRVVGVLLREVHTGRRGEGAGAAGVYGTGMVRFNTIQHYSVFQTGQNQGTPYTCVYSCGSAKS